MTNATNSKGLPVWWGHLVVLHTPVRTLSIAGATPSRIGWLGVGYDRVE